MTTPLRPPPSLSSQPASGSLILHLPPSQQQSQELAKGSQRSKRTLGDVIKPIQAPSANQKPSSASSKDKNIEMEFNVLPDFLSSSTSATPPSTLIDREVKVVEVEPLTLELPDSISEEDLKRLSSTLKEKKKSQHAVDESANKRFKKENQPDVSAASASTQPAPTAASSAAASSTTMPEVQTEPFKIRFEKQVETLSLEMQEVLSTNSALFVKFLPAFFKRPEQTSLQSQVQRADQIQQSQFQRNQALSSYALDQIDRLYGLFLSAHILELPQIQKAIQDRITGTLQLEAGRLYNPHNRHAAFLKGLELHQKATSLRLSDLLKELEIFLSRFLRNEFRLSNSKNIQPALEALAKAQRKFRELNLENASIQDEHLKAICTAMPSLQILNLNGTPITNLQSVQTLQDLRVLKIGYCPFLSANEIKTTGERLPKLKDIFVKGCTLSGLTRIDTSCGSFILKDHYFIRKITKPNSSLLER